MAKVKWALAGLASLLLAACGNGPNIDATTSRTALSTENARPPIPTLPVPTTIILVTQVVTVAPPAPPPAATNTPIPPPPPTATPVPTVAITNVQGATLLGTASVTIKGPPNTPCSIAYTTPAGTNSGAQGLVMKTTDGNGVAMWSWTIGSFTRPGTGKVAVTCGGARATADIKVG